MSTTAVKILGSIRKMSVKPGDVVVLKINAPLTMDEREQVRETLRGVFPNNKAMILDNNTSISVMAGNHDAV